MRALQLAAPNRRLVEVELPDPTPGPGDVVIEVTAAGICHSDVHYRAGSPAPHTLPVIPGHEVAGRIVASGHGTDRAVGERVAVHYQIGCGHCSWCRSGHEQFCADGAMIGNHRNGGYAEYVVVPGRNALPVPDRVPDHHAAALMCSSATSLHALRKGRVSEGESVAVFGCGGLGLSAIQLARAEGAGRVFGIDISAEKRTLAAPLGAEPIDGDEAVAALLDATAGRGVDVAVDLVGSGAVMEAALHSLAPMGRAVAVGLTLDRIDIGPYTDLVHGERELIGCSDHLASEARELLAMTAAGVLDLDPIVTACVPLEANAVNRAMDLLEGYSGPVRTVIVPRNPAPGRGVVSTEEVP